MAHNVDPCSSGILCYIPWPSNTGYAMHRAESQFFEMSKRLVADHRQIHFAYTSLSSGHPTSLPANFANVHTLDIKQRGSKCPTSISSLIRGQAIDLFFGYDLPVAHDAYPGIRRAGVRTIVAYWGAPMSSINSGLRLAAKRLQVFLHRNKPDHFVFQSKAMQMTGVRGRGVPVESTSVVYTGIDATLLVPRVVNATHVHETFSIPAHRKIIVFSGHVHERKGVAVLLRATQELVKARTRDDVHVLILGEIQESSQGFVKHAHESGISDHVTFAGYRQDVFSLFSGCWLGVAPTTGWDSFPRSVLEIQGTGLPMIVSDYQGLPEMIENGVTGLLFERGNHIALADKIEYFLENEALSLQVGMRARERILKHFTQTRLIDELTEIVRQAHKENTMSIGVK